jgi:hypothetical protein
MMTGFTHRKLWYLPPASAPGEDQQAVGGVGEGSVTARLQEVRNKGMIRSGLQRQGLGTVSPSQRCDVCNGS